VKRGEAEDQARDETGRPVRGEGRRQQVHRERRQWEAQQDGDVVGADRGREKVVEEALHEDRDRARLAVNVVAEAREPPCRQRALELRDRPGVVEVVEVTRADDRRVQAYPDVTPQDRDGTAVQPQRTSAARGRGRVAIAGSSRR
jgi:hypothetical protein